MDTTRNTSFAVRLSWARLRHALIHKVTPIFKNRLFAMLISMLAGLFLTQISAAAAPPTVPHITATAYVDPGQLYVGWSQSTGYNGTVRYYLYRNGTSVGSAIQLGLTDTGLANSTTYTYTVKACDDNNPSNCSALSSPVLATTNPPPTVPSILAVSGGTLGKLRVSWSQSTGYNGTVRYYLYRNGAPVGSAITTLMEDSGLADSTAYTYTVKACDENKVGFLAESNCSALSAAVSGTTSAAADITSPSIPTGLTATADGSTKANLSWTASTDNVGVSSYKIYRNGSKIATLGNVTSYGDTGLSANTSYSFTVVACDAVPNCSLQSPPITVTTSAVADTTPPSIPTSLIATADGATKVNLTWMTATDNIGVTGYKLYRDNGLLVTLGNVTSHTDTGLSANITYSYSVMACDAAPNCSLLSIPILVTTRSTSGTLTSVALSCPAAIASGKTGSCSATASYNDNTSKTVVPTWTIPLSTAATIDAAGTITAKSVTTDTNVVVSASYSEGGITKSATADVTIQAAATSGCLGTEPYTAAITIAGNSPKKAGDSLDASYCMKRFDPNNKYDIYAALLVPDGSLLFIETSLFGTTSFTTNAAPYLANIAGSDRTLTILNIANLPTELPTGKYTFYAIPVLAGKTVYSGANWAGQLSQGEFTFGN